MAKNISTFGIGLSFDKATIGTVKTEIANALKEVAAEMGSYMGPIDKALDDGFKGFKAFKNLSSYISDHTKEIGKSFELLARQSVNIKVSSDALSHLATGMASFNDISKAGMSNFKTLNATASELAIGLKNLGNVKLDKAGENIKNIGTVIGKIDPASVKTFKDLAKGVNSLSAAFDKMPDATSINAKGEAIKGMTDTTVGGLFKNIGEIRAKSLFIEGEVRAGGLGGRGGRGGSNIAGGGSADDTNTVMASIQAKIIEMGVSAALKGSTNEALLSQKISGVTPGLGVLPFTSLPLSKGAIGSHIIDIARMSTLNPTKGGFSEGDMTHIFSVLAQSALNNRNTTDFMGASGKEGFANRLKYEKELTEVAETTKKFQTGLGMDTTSSLGLSGMLLKNTGMTTERLSKLSETLIATAKNTGLASEGLQAVLPQIINLGIVTGKTGDEFAKTIKTQVDYAATFNEKGINAGRGQSFLASPFSGSERDYIFARMAGVTGLESDTDRNNKLIAQQKATMPNTGNPMDNALLYGMLQSSGVISDKLTMQETLQMTDTKRGYGFDENLKLAQAAKYDQAIVPFSDALGTLTNAIKATVDRITSVTGISAAAAYDPRAVTTPSGREGNSREGIPRATGGMVTGEESGHFGDSVHTRLTPGEYVLPKGETKELIYKMADKYGIDRDIYYKQIQTESNFNPKARSKAGAMGLGQLMPATARALGVKDPYDPVQNLEGSARHYSNLLKKYGGDNASALAAYNEGEGAFNRGKMPTETRNYVAKIMGRSNELYSSTTSAVNQAMTATRDIAVNTNRELNATLSDLGSSITTALSSSKMDSAADGLIQAAQMMLMAVQKMAKSGLGGNGTVEALARGMAPYASWGRS